MERVLFVSATTKSADALCDLASKAISFITPFPCTSGSRCRRLVLDELYDLVVINYPLQDDDATELARMIVTSTDAEVILIVKEELYEEFSALLSDSSIILITKPIILQIFTEAIKLSFAFKRRCDKLIKENKRLETKVEELKLISRAKSLLIMKKGCSEEEAHHLIERRAMNNRITLSEAAMAIIRIYST